jgi:8-oxo-dGTP pyrophosphatase MutT (NUDIX family)
LLSAKRECEEETWLIPQDISLYYISKVWATIERDLYYYVITTFVHHEKWQQLELWENIIVEWKTKEEIFALIKQWAMREDRSVGVLLRYLS